MTTDDWQWVCIVLAMLWAIEAWSEARRPDG